MIHQAYAKFVCIASLGWLWTASCLNANILIHQPIRVPRLEVKPWSSEHRCFKLQSHADGENSVPSKTSLIRQLFRLATAMSLASCMTMATDLCPANAIGKHYEFKDQNMVLQDVSFNVADIDRESTFFKLLFQDTCKVLRTSSQGDQRTAVLGFGPDTYNKPANFYPGVSSFFEDGGHATITLLGKRSGSAETTGVSSYYVPGNALQYVKFGTEILRLSKGIESGKRNDS
jgi:hypothetical protein